jgi:hypothetical protein
VETIGRQVIVPDGEPGAFQVGSERDAGFDPLTVGREDPLHAQLPANSASAAISGLKVADEAAAGGCVCRAMLRESVSPDTHTKAAATASCLMVPLSDPKRF